MGIVKRILILLLIASAVGAQSMQRDSLRSVVYDQLLIPSLGDDQITSTRFNRVFSRGILDISVKCPAYEKFDTVVISSGMEGGPLNTDFVAVKSVAKMIGDTLRIPLTVVPYDDTLYNLMGGTVDKATMDRTNMAQPRYYSAFGGKLILWQKYNRPAESDSFVVQYYATAPAVTADATSASISTAYREALIYFCCARLCEIRKDFQEASYWDNKYETELSRRGLIGGNNIQAAGGYHSGGGVGSSNPSTPVSMGNSAP